MTTAFVPPSPERNRQINMALVRAIQRCQARKAALANAPQAKANLRDRMGQIITIDRADTDRSISATAAIINQ